MVIVGAEGEEAGELLFNSYKVPVLQDEGNSGDGYF